MNSLEALERIEKEILNQKATIYPNTFIDLMEIYFPNIKKDLEKFQAIENKGLKYEDDILSFEDNQGRRLVVNDTLVDYYVKYSAIENADLSRAEKNFDVIYNMAGEYADLVGLNRNDTINCNKERVDNFFKKSKLFESKVKLIDEYLELFFEKAKHTHIEFKTQEDRKRYSELENILYFNGGE